MRIGLEIIINQIPIIDDNEKQRLISEIPLDSLIQSDVHAALDQMRQYLSSLSTMIDDEKVKENLRDLMNKIESAGVMYDLNIETFECSECAFRRIDYEQNIEHNDFDGEYILEYENACLECFECGNEYQQAWNSTCSVLF
ncbi:hypothetical protein Ga0123461_0694 [Mariprofundus aestuarium]|uniref:Uncharacterized protein n=1 Tax=Mariprofundus aestuarium TaxID=1921086 RepID=A0A2K8KW79_MARES|nr:hypothetical protein [Mariprofundus aestuarium]ATX79120.1 hypothetical protein Ga0123461_0694 [Mariprofundus aestuarium]